MDETGRLRIGELSRRVGESPELLRAWESRYGLVTPERTSGGLRLYSERDERRIRVMRHHINAGLSAAEAARLAKLAEVAQDQAQPLRAADIDAALQRSFEALDEPAAQATLDRLLIAFGLRRALGEVILPFLHGLGERWAVAETSVAQEHFASNIIGGRLRSLAQGWGQGVGPRAVLACPPGELHELGLLAFGLVLRERGWRITYLGADTPLRDIITLAELAPEPAIVVLAAVTEQRFVDSAGAIRDLAGQFRLGIAGGGATPALARKLGVESLAGNLLAVAETLAP
jgi:MerR family transcriptional regulator, light-induced transcriptional regulator